MRVLFISGREPAYMRNSVILKGLKSNGVEVIECTSPSTSYKTRYYEVLKKFLQNSREDYDALFVGYFGQPLVPICRKFSKKPIIFDAFLSAYDTMCFDRKKHAPNSAMGKFYYWLDKHSCQLADAVLLDTNAHVQYFKETFGLNEDKFHRAFVGADPSIFYPREHPNRNNIFTVLYYTTYHPLHGVDNIIHAAKLLQDVTDLKFKIFGHGMEYEKIICLTQELAVKNIEFIGWIPYSEFYQRISSEIAQADVCLGGHFSNINKGKRVIAEKTFEFIAMRRPVIVGDNSANRELFKHKESAFFVRHADPKAIADGIVELKEDGRLRKSIADSGYTTFLECCTPEVIGAQIKEIIEGHL